ncbi:transmembrane protease serine 2-like [Lampris incognitus]|uniref:transmembrane protease serine 2-like n=1 Tax=Lampris incognitus TaxID=2546036 RepID=UPI0024B4A358|nr:transmembrane protease serine 2-like [Lampris incognitus]
MPVCAEGWSDSDGEDACEQIGYNRESYVSSTKASAGALSNDGYMKLKPEYQPGSLLQSRLSYNRSCSANAVSLRCIGCGERTAFPVTRIVGGTEAAEAAWPWQASLQMFNHHVCGGSIIESRWILSAAHCFEGNSDPELWTVHAGSVDLSFLRTTPGYAVQKLIVHPNYNEKTKDNDVALMKLFSPLTFSRRVRPVCLPNAGVDLSPGCQAWITGWGAQRFQGSSPDTLNQAEVTMYSREQCNTWERLDGLDTTP